MLSLMVTNLARHSSTNDLKSIKFFSRGLILITEITEVGTEIVETWDPTFFHSVGI